MKDLLSKEHYCYKIHTLLLKSSAYPLSPIWTIPILKENLEPHLSMIFQNLKPHKNKGWVHTMT